MDNSVVLALPMVLFSVLNMVIYRYRNKFQEMSVVRVR